MCLVEGEKIRSEGGCFRSVFVEVGGQRHSRVGEGEREREIGTKYTIVLTGSWSNQLWIALQAWYLYPQATAPDILAYYRCRLPTMDSVNTASKRPCSTLPRNGRVLQKSVKRKKKCTGFTDLQRG
jgi:hypothetical protein